MNWQAINNTASIISFISFIPIVWSFVLIIRFDRRRHRNLKMLRKHDPREKSAVLIVDIGNDVAMRESVEQWLYSQEDFKGFPDDNIHHIPLHKYINENDTEEVMKRIRKTRIEMIGKGARKIHMFYRGPVALATMIGAELSNGSPVIIYQNDPRNPNGYVNWGLMER